MTVEVATQLKQVIEEKWTEWDSLSNFNINNVPNVSSSELSKLERYTDHFIASNGTGFNGLISPTGKVAEILQIYSILM